MESILVPRQEMERNVPDKSSMILESAEKVFAKKGFDRTKMTEIARMAGVGDGTVYEYFENKEVLLFSIPKRHFENYREDLLGIFHPDSVVRKLKKWIRYHFTTLMAEPHFLRIYVINLFLNKGFYHSGAFESFRGYFGLLEEVLEEGKKNGVFRQEVNPRIYRNMVLGTFCHMATRWLGDLKMSEVSRMKEVNQVVDLFADAILA
jgi:TetR/AcrR family fatty acid metabolism transcriptional regulator